MPSIELYTIASVVAVLVGGMYLLTPRFGPNEPPRVQPQIPVVGHLIGLLTDGYKYYRQVSTKTNAPIFILPILNGGVTIARSKDVIAQISRNSKTLSFDILQETFMKRLTDAGPDALKVVTQQEGDHVFTQEVHKLHAKLLMPGEHLTAVEKNFYARLSRRFQDEAGGISSNGSSIVELFEWSRGVLNGTTLKTFYGEVEPFIDTTKFEADWYAYEYGLDALMYTSGIAPQIFARKAYLGRERIIKALTKYYNGQPPEESVLGKERKKIALRTGLKFEDLGRLEVAALIGFIGNTAPSLFYLLAEIYNHPGLLEQIRAELYSQLKSISPNYKPGNPIPFSFLTGLRSTCTLYKSTYDEILRLHQGGNSVRLAVEDTWVRDKSGGSEKAYLLKKDSVVLMPNTIIHRDENAFPESDKFDPRRFISNKPAEHRPWGGGSTICPGRVFATAETMATGCLILLGFELECVDAQGKKVDWFVPEDAQRNMAAGVFQPTKPLNVRIKRREEQSLELNLEA